MPQQTALRFFNIVYGELSLIRKQRFSHDLAIYLVANQREYILDPAYLKIESATYDADGTSAGRVTLQPVRMDELYFEEESWRYQAAAIPRQYYIHPGSQSPATQWMIGFYPTPPTSTVGVTYPRVSIAASLKATFALSDTAPEISIDSNVFIEGMCFLWDRETRQQNMAASHRLYQMEQEKCATYWDSKNVQLRPQIVVGHPGRYVPQCE